MSGIITVAPAADGRPRGGGPIQLAIDLAAQDGSTVQLTAGTWELADAICLRSGVTLRGEGSATVLTRRGPKASALAGLLAYGRNNVRLRDPDAFAVGDGVTISDSLHHGYHSTRATIIARDGDAWILSTGANADHDPLIDARAVNAFPLIAAEDVDGAVIEDLRLIGNAEDPEMDSCRGAAVYGLRARGCTFRRLVCDGFAGDGFSLQFCVDGLLEGCVARGCAGNGYHPGSGSRRLRFRDCHAIANRGMGIFFCIGVQDCLVTGGELAGNHRHGVSLGADDAANRLEGVRITGNGGAAVHLRRCDRIHAPSGTTLAGCTLGPDEGAGVDAEVVVQGEVEGVRLLDCRIDCGRGLAGISIAAEAGDVDVAGTTFSTGGLQTMRR
nr:right-handed parallel beta-helix repeat-containing protein [Planctomycetota bacterium]